MITGPRSAHWERAIAVALVTAAAVLGAGCTASDSSEAVQEVRAEVEAVPTSRVGGGPVRLPDGGLDTTTRPGVPAEPVLDEVAAEAEAAIERYREALLAQNGPGAAAEVSASTFTWYEETRDLARSAPPDQLTGDDVPLLQAVAVIQFRALLGADLEGMTGQDLVEWGVDQGLIGNAAAGTSLSGVVTGEDGEVFGLVDGIELYRFVDEGGAWKIDLPHTLDQVAQAGEDSLLQELSGGEATTRPEVFELLAQGYGTTWDEISQPTGTGEIET